MKLETEFILEYPHFEELSVLELKENWRHVSLDHIGFCNAWEKSLISWNYQKDCQEFMTYSMFPS